LPVKRIVIAEDDERFGELLGDALAQDGYQTVVVRDGLAVLNCLQTEAVDLLVLDINMPELGGASLVERLRRDPDWERFAVLPIIIVSGMWDVVTFDLDVQAGFAKPISVPDLRAKVRELIGLA
jgi:DNA-binding response OmpR family regulator